MMAPMYILDENIVIRAGVRIQWGWKERQAGTPLLL